MKLIASGTGRCHAPELTRIAFISAFVTGADGFRLPLRLTSDKRVVVFEDETTDRLTSTAGAVSDLTLDQLRALDIGANFTEPDGSRFNYPGRVESFGLLLDALPPTAYLALELKPEPDASRRMELASQAAAGIANRARQALTLVFGQEADALAEFRKKCPGAATALYSPVKTGAQALADALTAKADAVVLPVDALVGAQDALTPLAADVRAAQTSGKLPLGALSLSTGGFPASAYAALKAEKAIWGLVVESLVQAAAEVRPGWLWVDEQWGQKAANGQDVNTHLWRLGYAKYNREGYCHVFPDNGIHVDIKPFAGSTSFSHGDAVERDLQRLLSRTWDALKDWPFYSGGGVGFVPGIEGDFSAEIDVQSEIAQQATTVEMAVLNADPGAHRPPWITNTAGKLVPNPPASFRDKHTFYDPHGAPPYVGVEHDEDDGWRINWNFGTDYDSNQYGRAVGDGKLLTGRMRLDRRGAYFAAYYRATGKSRPEDWVCLGGVRNESLNPKIYLRLAGKRWRQEDPNNPSAFMPIIPNHFTFKNFTITRFP